MLRIKVPPAEFYDEETQEFTYTKGCTLTMEHSLLSISKWESKWHKPFIVESDETHSAEEMLDYFRCMSIDPTVDSNVFLSLSKENLDEINSYISNPMTATTFSHMRGGAGKSGKITSELIYYWMVACNIPFECEKWHINRLITLIRVCEAKNNPKKMGRNEILARNQQLNAVRRKAHAMKRG